MKQSLSRWAAGLLIALPLLAPCTGHAAPETGVQWRPSFQVAIQEAKRTHKPLLVYFYTSWCSPCQVLDTKTFTNKGVIAASQKWIPVKVDGDHDGGLDKKYGLNDHFPTVVLIRPNGMATRHILGFQTPAYFINAMNAGYGKTR